VGQLRLEGVVEAVAIAIVAFGLRQLGLRRDLGRTQRPLRFSAERRPAISATSNQTFFITSSRSRAYPFAMLYENIAATIGRTPVVKINRLAPTASRSTSSSSSSTRAAR